MKIYIMRRLNIFIILLCATILVLGGLYTKNISIFTSTNRKKNLTIAIDAGHGGMDPGAMSQTGIKEKDINLLIAQKIKFYFESVGDTVILTRDTDIGLYDDTGSVRDKKRQDLKRRKEILTKNNIDFFVTIHLNSFPQEKEKGAQTFYLKNNEKSKIISEMVLDNIKLNLDTENKRLAKEVENVYIMENIKTDGFLIECGFLSNVQEAEKLTKDNYQDEIAWYIFLGIKEYYNQNY